MTTEGQTFDKIIEGIAANNGEYYIKHSDKSLVFTVKREPKWKGKNFFEKLKTDVNSVMFTEEKIDNRLLKKLKKLSFLEDKKLADLISAAENFDLITKSDSKTLPRRLDYVEKRQIDRSTLHSVESPFQLVHADIGNLRFLGKSAAHPKYCLVAVDVYSSKVYVYPMRSRDL